MKILIDENIPGLASRLRALGEVRTSPGRAIAASDLREVDVLLVRSVTRVDRALLQGSAVSFVGSCTAGVDHIDQAWLRDAGIAFAYAPGANARSVVEYVLSALCWLSVNQRFGLAGKTVGIVGLGNIGGRLYQVLQGLGVHCIGYDPFVDAGEGVVQVASLEQALAADVVTLHTPLSRGGGCPTWHMLDATRLSTLRRGALLINSSRGGVVDNVALQRVLEERPDLNVVLDAWEGEPNINPALLQRAVLATPHIAGYSYDGKLCGAEAVYGALLRWMGRRAETGGQVADRGETLPMSAPPATGRWEYLCRLMLSVYDISQDDRRMREALGSAAEPGKAFESLRRDYPRRRELSHYSLCDGSRNPLDVLLSGVSGLDAQH